MPNHKVVKLTNQKLVKYVPRGDISYGLRAVSQRNEWRRNAKFPPRMRRVRPRCVCVTHSQTKSAAVVMLLAAPEDSHILFVMLLNIHTFSTIPNASLEAPFHCSYQHEWTNAHCISGLLVGALTAARTKLDPSYRLAVRTSWVRSAPISLLFSHMRCRWLRADIVDKKCVN